MSIKRRNFMKMLPLAMAAPSQLMYGLSDQHNAINTGVGNSLSGLSASDERQKDIEEFYKKSIIIDGMIIPRGWNQDSFDALAKSGYTGFGASLASGNLKVALAALNEWTQRIKDNPNVLMHAKTANDFRTAKKEGKTAAFLGFQNATMIEKSISNIDKLYEAGTRWIQMTYNQRNLLGDGSTERTNCALSDFGVEAVEKMNEIGIMIDLSHCGRATTDDTIAISKSGVAFNHTMCESIHKYHPRAKTDAQIKAMADKGGMMGIIALGYMIGPNLGTDTTLETYLDHIDHAVQIGGIDHVGIATDFAIQGLEATGATRENWYIPRLTRFKPSYKVQWPPWIPELEKPDRYIHVARGLDRRGYSTGDMEKILGLNWLNYFDSVLK